MVCRMAKRVRDAEGGVSQCGEQRSTKRSEARSSPTRRETPKNQCVIIELFNPNGTLSPEGIFFYSWNQHIVYQTYITHFERNTSHNFGGIVPILETL